MQLIFLSEWVDYQDRVMLNFWILSIYRYYHTLPGEYAHCYIIIIHTLVNILILEIVMVLFHNRLVRRRIHEIMYLVQCLSHNMCLGNGSSGNGSSNVMVVVRVVIVIINIDTIKNNMNVTKF